MEASRKKVLEVMQKGLVSYKLLNEGWDVSDHYGDGCDLIAEKVGRFIKIELKAIDLNRIKIGKNATQHVSANELVCATHIIITVLSNIEFQGNFVMNIRQFVENSGVKKYNKYKSYAEFIEDYKKMTLEKSRQVKGSSGKIERLHFDFNFNPNSIENWKLYKFKEQWENLDKG
jgi:hypothetical protein